LRSSSIRRVSSRLAGRLAAISRHQVVSLLDRDSSDSDRLANAVDRYIDGPRPLYTKLPASYRRVPLRARTTVLRGLARLRPAASADFPDWPIERRIDEADGRSGRRLSYAGKPAAVVITHDLDSRPELAEIDRIRDLEASLGLISAFGFVPTESWPTEHVARSLVDQGFEVYWHDIAHNGRLPYLGKPGIRAEFDRIAKAHPWAVEMMGAFRAGQLLVSRDLMDVVAERFQVDLSIPDSERDGPYGGAAGCGTVIPFRYGPLLELPLTLPQEVYLHMVYRLPAQECLRIWIEKLAWVRSIGGVAVFNIHPVWVNAAQPELFAAFKDFLQHIAQQSDVLVTTPTALARVLEQASPGS
jgi:hypothetical protein